MARTTHIFDANSETRLGGKVRCYCGRIRKPILRRREKRYCKTCWAVGWKRNPAGMMILVAPEFAFAA